LHGIVLEQHFVKKAAGQFVKLAVTLLSEAHAGQQEDRYHSRDHGFDYSEASGGGGYVV
jgi:hypothetical protein